ncbi:hypothetical protein B0T18DRAFT_394462 [Schizothecium vesticola]|uniref:RRM domain-containing protein n=1 Tax=Schizothecium vesticola TaxID=314040 RepID=A0AA40BPU1_9PEZI|nr:hypothetical protein B0T18DRAFT_394462 [Schizothecium vesticola]
MSAGTPNHLFPHRRASESDEGRGKTDAHPTGSHHEDEVILEDFLDILCQESRAIELLGRDLIVDILRTGRGLGVGNASSSHHATNSAAASGSHGSSSDTSTSANINASGSFSPSTVRAAVPTHHSTNAIRVTPAIPTHHSTNVTRVKLEHCTETALSAAYRGDPRLVENYSAAISPDQSTSLFIKNLPVGTTITKILAHIRATGKVFSLYLNPPTPPHHGCAAKICFFTREVAATFYHNTRSGFLIDGHCATVVW